MITKEKKNVCLNICVYSTVFYRFQYYTSYKISRHYNFSIMKGLFKSLDCDNCPVLVFLTI